LHSSDPPLVHRDLKSPNVLLSSKNPHSLVVAKVADFGTSMHLFLEALREQGSDKRGITLPNWLSPEIIAEQEYTEKSRLECLCCNG